jgi:chromosome segregation ATPase
MDNHKIWEWLSYVITGGSGFGLYHLYDVYIRGKRDKKELESEGVRVANESRDRDIEDKREQDETERKFRDELREEISILRGQVVSMQQEIKTTNERYYQVLEENAKIKGQYEFAIREIELLRKQLEKVHFE